MADAKKAIGLTVDGILPSNHTGRQVDGAIASLDALEKIRGCCWRADYGESSHGETIPVSVQITDSQP